MNGVKNSLVLFAGFGVEVAANAVSPVLLALAVVCAPLPGLALMMWGEESRR